MPLKLEDVQDVLSQEIELAKKGDKKLTYCPITQRFHIFRGKDTLWPEGERNVIYAIQRYNDLEVKEAGHG